MVADKTNVLLVGSGGIGTIAALNLQRGNQASVTCVLRSNFAEVKENGFKIESIDWGSIESFRPDQILNSIPDVSSGSQKPFRYIVCTTKNIADVSPTLAELIKPAVTPGYTVIVLVQNGLNIERPIIEAYPENIVLSGVSLCGSHETAYGHIIHEDSDELYIGPFRNPSLDPTTEDDAAKNFIQIYSASGKTQCEYAPNVGWTRWRKLLYNACLNPVCAITDLDTGRARLAPGTIEDLVRPAMEEIRAGAKAVGHDLPAELVDFFINLDPIPMYNPPSMQVDVRKGRFTEFENILGEPLKEGAAHGVPMPTLKFLYSVCRSLQWRTKEKNGLVTVPPAEDFTKPTK
ncbi:uncharacterized protein K452DRAFT_258460 [Aplosporella prunicola CBS 121167]|uniref:2-dehydropantoate 2-reductase n=1 Tax=Aplosporella prunicola CBS 121167 TaxID=1176127 RepID=A0A6A6B0E5_9PEZI|nr:uncharacterized protein K452DRAFT_258460 [Aplosporella prunicola CBS 121167]KAF2136913.1 hypothetical protein K452DRAFT_258460 [Aplosporella prunicola CBS 121167]